MLEKLRIKLIHKLKGLTLEEVQKTEHIEIKAFTAVPEKVTAKMILHAGREYARRLFSSAFPINLRMYWLTEAISISTRAMLMAKAWNTSSALIYGLSKRMCATLT